MSPRPVPTRSQTVAHTTYSNSTLTVAASTAGEATRPGSRIRVRIAEKTIVFAPAMSPLHWSPPSRRTLRGLETSLVDLQHLDLRLQVDEGTPQTRRRTERSGHGGDYKSTAAPWPAELSWNSVTPPLRRRGSASSPLEKARHRGPGTAAADRAPSGADLEARLTVEAQRRAAQWQM